MANSRAHSDGASGVKGITKENGRWRARICVNGEIIRLGTFGARCIAAATYKQAALVHFGPFARV